ncbi:hypothetical protein [Nocardiopsis oceani]
MSAPTPPDSEPVRSGGNVTVTMEGPVATGTLANPGRRNTMTERMWPCSVR